MTRRITCGFDIPIAGTATSQCPEGEGQRYSANTVSFDTTVKHGSLGYSSLSISGSTGLNGKYSLWDVGAGSPNFTMELDRNYYLRFYLRVAGSPSSQIHIVSTSLGNFSLRIETSRALRLYDSSDTAVGSPSSPLSADTWYEVGLRYQIPTSGDGELELRLDKSTVSSVSCDVGSDVFGGLMVGAQALVSVGTTIYIDDLALNDDQGSPPFNTWPETGYCMLLRPISDSAIGKWEQPQTSGRDTTGLYQAVDNPVPVGVAHSDTDANNLRYVFNILSGSNNEYIANVDDYANAGVPSGAIIRVVQGVVRVSINSLTGKNIGAVRIASNPTTAYQSFDFETGQGSAGAVAGTEPAGWKTVKTQAATNPAVTRGTDPLLTLRKATSTTRAAMCDLMAVLVEYNDSPTLTPSSIESTAGIGVAHIELVTEQPLSPAGIGSTCETGTPTLALGITPVGVASTSACGAPSLAMPLSVVGLAPTAGVGEAAVSVGLSPEGIGSTVVLGEALIGAAISPAGVVPSSAAGTPALSVALAPEGPASTTALGVAALTSELHPAGLASGAALGEPALSVSLAPAGIAAVSDVGAPTFSVASTPAGIGSTSEIGAAAVGVSLSTSGIESSAALGTVTLSAGLAPIGIATTTTFGEPSLSVPVSVTGIAATVAMGVPALASALGPVGIASTEQLGEPSITVEIAPAGIGSALTFGTPTLATPLSVAGIASTSEVGSAALALGLAPTGVASAAAFGAPTLVVPLTVDGIASTAQLGAVALAVGLAPNGIGPTATLGEAHILITLDPGLGPEGLPSDAEAGLASLSLRLSLTEIAPTSAVGEPSAEPLYNPVRLTADIPASPHLRAELPAAAFLSAELADDPALRSELPRSPDLIVELADVPTLEAV